MGSGNEVEIKYTADDRDHLKSLNKQHLEILRNQRALIRMGDAGGKSFRKVKSGAGNALGTLTKFAGAITGIGGTVGGLAIAARQLLVEFNRIKELQQSDADKQVAFENSLVKAVRNAGGFFSGEDVKKIALDLEGETGASPTKVAESLSSAFSARGATNKQQAQEAVQATAASLRFAPDLSAEDTADLTGAGIDLSKRFGFSPEEALGFLKNVGSLARVVDPQKLADQVAPAIASLSDFGNTGQEAGSLIAAITQGSVDKNAARSATAAIQLAAQIRERGIGGSTTEGIDLLANDPQLRKKFFEGGSFNGKKFPAASFEKRQLTAIEQLLQPGSVTRTAFKEGIGQIGGKKEAREAYETSIAENASVTRTSRFRRQSEASAEASGIKDEVGGIAAEARNALGRALDEANFSDARKKALLGEFEVRSSAGREDPLQVGESILEREQKRLLSTEQTISGGAGGRGVVVADEVTEEEKQSAAALRAQEVIFERFIKEQQRAPAAGPAPEPAQVQGQLPRPPGPVPAPPPLSNAEQFRADAEMFNQLGPDGLANAVKVLRDKGRQGTPQNPEPHPQSADNKSLLAAMTEQTGVIRQLLKQIVNQGKGPSQPESQPQSQPQPQRPQVRAPERRPPYQSPSAILSRRD